DGMDETETPEFRHWYIDRGRIPLRRAAAYGAAKVTPMLQDTAVVISQFQTAAAAGSPPDMQCLWNGIYHMESV
ncbi:MAG: hypothetical protein H7245_24710, partial [Candidatus Saccharibacteria bacterium]|nr:hypothetical protein [Pseudorhodobacter sp.]